MSRFAQADSFALLRWRSERAEFALWTLTPPLYRLGRLSEHPAPASGLIPTGGTRQVGCLPALGPRGGRDGPVWRGAGRRRFAASRWPMPPDPYASSVGLGMPPSLPGAPQDPYAMTSFAGAESARFLVIAQPGRPTPTLLEGRWRLSHLREAACRCPISGGCRLMAAPFLPPKACQSGFAGWTTRPSWSRCRGSSPMTAATIGKVARRTCLTTAGLRASKAPVVIVNEAQPSSTPAPDLWQVSYAGNSGAALRMGDTNVVHTRVGGPL